MQQKPKSRNNCDAYTAKETLGYKREKRTWQQQDDHQKETKTTEGQEEK